VKTRAEVAGWKSIFKTTKNDHSPNTALSLLRNPKDNAKKFFVLENQGNIKTSQEAHASSNPSLKSVL